MIRDLQIYAKKRPITRQKRPITPQKRPIAQQKPPSTEEKRDLGEKPSAVGKLFTNSLPLLLALLTAVLCVQELLGVDLIHGSLAFFGRSHAPLHLLARARAHV